MVTKSIILLSINFLFIDYQYYEYGRQTSFCFYPISQHLVIDLKLLIKFRPTKQGVYYITAQSGSISSPSLNLFILSFLFPIFFYFELSQVQNQSRYPFILAFTILIPNDSQLHQNDEGPSSTPESPIYQSPLMLLPSSSNPLFNILPFRLIEPLFQTILNRIRQQNMLFAKLSFCVSSFVPMDISTQTNLK